MTREDAAALVDAWVSEWRLFLDGGLHKRAREALIVRLTTTPDEAPKRKRGRPPGTASMNEGA